jgi:ubiquinone/menaquinone biosynthesis C-methylase UbiE
MFYEKVARVFDAEANVYDKLILSNPSMKYAYLIAQNYLLNSFSKGDKVLDIGCGTGLQAIPLALQGCEVVAIDVSTEMLNILQKKVKELSLTNIKIYNLPASKLEKLLNIYGKDYFDGVYSFFGPLNAEPFIISFKEGLLKLLKKNGLFISLILNKINIYNIKSKESIGKYKGFIYRKYDYKEFLNIFKELKLEEIFSVNIFLPPPNFKISKNEFIVKGLYFIEKKFYNIKPFSLLGLHIGFKMRKI